MKRELGFARCGLACCLCRENENCPGCQQDGCADKDWCENRKCSLEKENMGCWNCVSLCGAEDSPCTKGLLAKPRVRAFARYLQKYGSEKLLLALEKNEKAGMQYHYPGELIGDYDCFDTEEEIWKAIDDGIQYKGLLIKESLCGEEILDCLCIENVEIWKTQDTPRYWTAISFSSSDPRFPEKLADELTGNWFVDMKLGQVKFIVFHGKVLRYRIGDAKQKEKVFSFCREMGIPERQMDWSE